MSYYYLNAKELYADIAEYERKQAHKIATESGTAADYIEWFYAAYDGEEE